MSNTSYENAIFTFADIDQNIEGISKVIIWKNKIIILLEPHLFGERNVKCYDFFGKLIWTIQNPIRVHPQYETYFVGLTIRDEKLLTYSDDGVEYDVSIETGSFNKHMLVK